MIERDPVEVLAEEFIERYRRGERPPISEYADRLPAQADRVRTTFPALALIEDLAISDFQSFDDSKQVLAELGENLPLEQLGDYRIIREIGRGGMGIVYEAEQLSLGRHVALKVLPPRALRNPQQKKRFEHEARAAARLHHTNVVPVFDVGEHEGMLYYVMQHIQGAGLDRVLAELRKLRKDQAGSGSTRTSPMPRSLRDLAAAPRRRRKRPVLARPLAMPASESAAASDDRVPRPLGDKDDTAVSMVSETSIVSGGSRIPAAGGRGPETYWQSVARIGVQVADALEYAHAQGITHRDIKPSNLLLDLRGTVWITDFGLAKCKGQEDLTGTGDFVGTLRYVAPERFDENAPPQSATDPRTDIYSLGLTLYELLAFKPAHDEDDRHRLMRQVLDTSPVRLRKLNPDIPRDLETIVHKAIERDPAHRIQTAGELAADLRRFLDDEPIRARRMHAPERVWRWCRRNPSVSITALVALLMVLATAIGAFVKVNAEKNENKELAGRLEIQKQHVEMALRRVNAARIEAATQAAEAAAQAAERKAVTDFLTLDIIAAARPEFTQGRPLTMRDLLDRAAVKTEQAFADDLRTQASIRNAIGQGYYSLGLYREAERQLDLALAIRQRLLTGDHLDTLATLNNLSLVLFGQSRLDEGRIHFEQVLKGLKKHYSDDHPDTLNAFSNIAAVHYSQGNFRESRRIQEQVLETLRRTRGPHDRQTISAVTNLGATLHAMGLYDEAQTLLVDADTNRRQIAELGDEHPLTLKIRGNLAQNLNRLGHHRQAEELGRSVHTIQSRVSGPRHPDTLTTLGNVAQALDFQGRHLEALPLHRQVLDGRTQALTAEHPDTLATKSNLAACLNQLGQHVEAQLLYEELIAVLTARLGESHLTTLAAMNNRAEVFRRQKLLATARQEFLRVIKLATESLGPDHRATLQFRRNLAGTLEQLELVGEAEDQHRDVLSRLRQTYGPADRETLQAVAELAALLVRQKQPGAAAALLQETLRDVETADPPVSARQSAVLKSLLGAALTADGRPAEAEPLLLAAWQTLSESRLAPPAETDQAVRRIIHLYETTGRTDEAQQWKSRRTSAAAESPSPITNDR